MSMLVLAGVPLRQGPAQHILLTHGLPDRAVGLRASGQTAHSKHEERVSSRFLRVALPPTSSAGPSRAVKAEVLLICTLNKLRKP